VNKIQYFIVAIFFGALLSQGFQCTSTEMSTARVARTQKDFTKAIAYYEKELKKNPSNPDALYELAETYQVLTDKRMGGDKADPDNIYKALPYAVQAKQLVSNMKNYKSSDRNKQIEFNVWASAFNQAYDNIKTIEDGKAKNQEELLKKTIDLLSNCAIINTDNPDSYSMMGTAYNSAKNQDKALESYEKYNKVMEKEINLAIDKGIYYGMKRDDAVKKLGKYKKVEETIPARYLKGDSLLYYTYDYPEGELTLYTQHDSVKKSTKVSGWKINASEFAKTQNFVFNVTPTIEIARIYFEKKNYDKATQCINLLKKLDPTNSSANQFLVQVLDIQGKKDEAMKAMKDLIAQDPKNVDYKNQYAQMLLNAKNYDEALSIYEEMIVENPNNKDARKIVGSLYKNKAAVINNSEVEKVTKDPSYKVNDALYMPYLNKSLEQFEYLIANGESSSYSIMLDLCDIYLITNQKDKLVSTAKRLIALKDMVETEDLKDYQLSMYNLLDKLVSKYQYKEFEADFNEFQKAATEGN
jgi:tetratricopeptide (TPR) repeat protein